jgi:hypothetical protein
MSTPNVSAIKADEIVSRKHEADQVFEEAVEGRVREIADAAGVLAEDGKIDKKVLGAKAYDVLKRKRVVDISTDGDDRRNPAKSSSREELAEALFSQMPTDAQADQNEVDAAVRGKCLGAVWDVCQTGQRGIVQQHLEGDGLILIRGKVYRGSITVKSGLYVSTHEEIVLREFLQPQLEKLQRVTDALKADYEMATERAGELAGPMREAIHEALVEATAKLPVATLTTATNGGRKALDK